MPRASTQIGQELNRSQAALFFGVAPTTMDNWRAQGCPARQNGKSVMFNSKEVFEWRIEKAKAEALKNTTGIGESDVKLRTMTAQMRIAELEAAKAEGEAISIEDWRKAHVDLVATTRSKVLAFPARYAGEIAQQVVDLVNPQAESEVLDEARKSVESILRSASAEVLTELSNSHYEEPEPEAEAA